MGLSCGCDGSLSEYSWMHEGPSDFHPFNAGGEFKRRKRCASCGKLLNFGEECVRFNRIRAPKSEIEERIFGDEIPIPAVFQCEDCAGIFVNLWELGYNCISPDTPVQELLADYWEITGFDPSRYAEKQPPARVE